MENLSMTHLYGFISNYDYGFIDTMWYHLRNHFPQLRTPMWVLTSAVGFVQMGWSILRELWEKTAVMMITYHHITLSIVSNHFLFSIFSTRIVSACFSHVSAMFQPCFRHVSAMFHVTTRPFCDQRIQRIPGSTEHQLQEMWVFDEVGSRVDQNAGWDMLDLV